MCSVCGWVCLLGDRGVSSMQGVCLLGDGGVSSMRGVCSLGDGGVFGMWVGVFVR